MEMPRQKATFVSPGDYRSGRGGGVQGGPADKWYDKHTLGDPPRETPRTGQTGSPSASFSTTASQIQQQGYAEDEIEYWKDASFDPPYVFRSDTMGQGKHGVRESDLRRLIRAKIMEALLGEYEDEDGDDVEEASSIGGGAIRGYTTPLGTGGNDDQKERLRVSEKSFGGGKMK